MEDGRLMKSERRLIVQLIPETAWYNNLRNAVKKSDWDKIRKKCYREANYTCEVCGGKGSKHPVECHELYTFEEGVIRLVGLIALCPECHTSVHPGLANIRGKYAQAVNQLAKVNKITKGMAEAYYRDCFAEWRELSKVPEWKTDFSWIEGYLDG